MLVLPLLLLSLLLSLLMLLILPPIGSIAFIAGAKNSSIVIGSGSGSGNVSNVNKDKKSTNKDRKSANKDRNESNVADERSNGDCERASKRACGRRREASRSSARVDCLPKRWLAILHASILLSSASPQGIVSALSHFTVSSHCSSLKYCHTPKFSAITHSLAHSSTHLLIHSIIYIFTQSSFTRTS